MKGIASMADDLELPAVPAEALAGERGTGTVAQHGVRVRTRR